jgi:hypothetical protein
LEPRTSGRTFVFLDLRKLRKDNNRFTDLPLFEEVDILSSPEASMILEAREEGEEVRKWRRRKMSSSK